MHFENEKVALPGQHPDDPSKADIDPVGYALERLQAYLIWSEEHRASYEKARQSKPEDADNEMNCLKDAIWQAIKHLQRLTELVLTGQCIDPKKKMPKGMYSEVWNRTVESIRHQQKRDGAE